MYNDSNGKNQAFAPQTRTDKIFRFQFSFALLMIYMTYVHRTGSTGCEDGGAGCGRIAIIIISQCDETRDVALNQQALWESPSIFQLNK